MGDRFLKHVLSERSERLEKDPNAFMILRTVARRANRVEQINRDGFGQFQCGIGKNDFPFMSNKEYRGAKQRLTRGRYADFKGQTQGTTVTLLDSTVWDINPETEGQAKGRVVKHEGQSSETSRAPNKNKEKEERKEIKYIVEFLNETCKTNFSHTTANTQKLINGRLNEGRSLEDFQKVISTKNREWGGTDRCLYLRPKTLFSQENFESYLNQNGVVHDDVESAVEQNRKELRKAGYDV